MQYVGADGLDRIIVCGSVKSGKRYRHDDPILIRIDPVDKNDDDSYKEEEQQQAPAFADLDKEFAEVLLDEVSPDDKRDDKPDDPQCDPDR